MQWDDLSISRRLALGFGFILLLVTIQVSLSVFVAYQTDVLEQRVSAVIVPRRDRAEALETAQLGQAIAVRSFALTGEERHVQEFRTALQRGRTALLELERVAVQGQDRAAVGDISALFAHYERLAEQMISAVRAGASRDELRSREEALGQVREQILDRTQHLIEDYLTDEAAAKAEIDRFQGARLVTLLLVAVLVLIAGSVSAAAAAQAVRGPAKRLVEAARAMSAGDYEPALALASPVMGTERVGEGSAPTPKNELRELMLAFSRMASALERREARLAAHAGVSHALSSSIDIDQISQSALTHIVNYTRCEFGAVYVAEPFSPSMRCVASYALDDTLEKVTPGQGLLGQAAKDRRTIVVRDIPVDSPFRLRFGVDSLPPRTLVATPLVFEQQLTGLVVLGSIRALDGDAVEFVEQTGQQFAISLRNALSHAAVTRLAVELDEKNEELQAQNEEIQAQNEEIQAQNEELQAQGEELQAQNEELETQRLQLLEADRQKDEFLSVASHELKSPITSLKGFVQLLRRRIRSRPELGDFDSTVANLERQTEIVVTRIERMLDASRAKMGRLQPRLGAVDLKELVRAEILQAQAKTGAHQIEGHFPSGSVVAQVDQGYIEQAVGNLLDNAIRYSPDGGEIRVSLSTDGHQACISVADSGIGISSEAREKLFQPYYRDAAAKMVTASGMGIGLYITREIVSAHGGRIEVDSEEGHGTEFTISLPLAVTDKPLTRRNNGLPEQRNFANV